MEAMLCRTPGENTRLHDCILKQRELRSDGGPTVAECLAAMLGICLFEGPFTPVLLCESVVRLRRPGL
jgi:hypothetical protein